MADARAGLSYVGALPDGDWRLIVFGGEVVAIDATGANEPRVVADRGVETIKAAATGEEKFNFPMMVIYG